MKNEELFRGIVRIGLFNTYYGVQPIDIDCKTDIFTKIQEIPNELVETAIAQNHLRWGLDAKCNLLSFVQNAPHVVVRSLFRMFESNRNFGKTRMSNVLVDHVFSGRLSHETMRYRESGELEKFVSQMAYEIASFDFFDGRISLSKDMMNEVFSYVPRTYSVVCSLGMVSSEWYYLLMSTWDTILITSGENAMGIHLLALRSAKTVIIVSTKIFKREIWRHIIKHIAPTKLDLGRYALSTNYFATKYRALELIKQRANMKKVGVNCLRNIRHLILPYNDDAHLIDCYCFGMPKKTCLKRYLLLPVSSVEVFDGVMNNYGMRVLMPSIKALENVPVGSNYDMYVDSIELISLQLVSYRSNDVIIFDHLTRLNTFVAPSNSYKKQLVHDLSVLMNCGSKIRNMVLYDWDIMNKIIKLDHNKLWPSLERIELKTYFSVFDFYRENQFIEENYVSHNYSSPSFGFNSLRTLIITTMPWRYVENFHIIFPNIEHLEITKLHVEIDDRVINYTSNFAKLMSNCNKVRICISFDVDRRKFEESSFETGYLADLWTSKSSGIITVRIYDKIDEFDVSSRLSGRIVRSIGTETYIMNFITSIIKMFGMCDKSHFWDWWREFVFSSPFYMSNEINERLWQLCMMDDTESDCMNQEYLTEDDDTNEWIRMRGIRWRTHPSIKRQLGISIENPILIND